MKTKLTRIGYRVAIPGTILIAAVSTLAVPPTINYQPTNATVVPGQQAIFSVTASGTAPLTYQWRKNSLPISGATTNVLLFNSVQFSNAGTYSVAVSNASGGLLSSNATLAATLPVGGDVDPSFTPGASMTERVNAFAVQSDGKVIIVGAFTAVNGVPRGRVARLNSDGTTDLSFMNRMDGANNYVYSVALQADGKILIGGIFSRVNGVLRFGIARLNTDGSVDTTFGNTTGANSAVTAITVQSDSKVLIGGTFTSINTEIRGRIARLNTDGSTDLTFQNGMSGASSQVNAIVVQTNGSIVIGGSFLTVNGTNRAGVARLSSTGVLDTNFLNGLSGLSGSYFGTTTVNSMALQTDGKIIIGGDFSSVNGTSRNCLARLNTDGTLDTSYMSGSTGTDNSPVNSIALQSDGNLIIGGYFFSFNGNSRPHIARLDTNGNVDTSFLQFMSGANNSVLCVAVQSDGKVYVGGFLTAVNGFASRSMARLNTNGSTDTGFFNGNAGANNLVRAVVEQPNGAVIIGGDFTAVNGVTRNQLARLNANGSLDTNYLNGLTGPNSLVFALALQSDSKLLLGGAFNFVNGVARGHVARLNTNGTLDTTFMSGLSGADNQITSMAVQTDGKVLIGGYFTTVDGTARSRVARLNSDGTLDATFLNGSTGANNTVDAMAIQSDGKIVIGGTFTSINGTNRNRVARLNSDGSLDTDFLNGLTGANSSVAALAIQTNGQILVAGAFSTMNGTSKSDLARLNSDGTLDTSFPNSSTGPNSAVYTMALAPSGKILIGGPFGFYNIITRNGFAQLNSDGSLDTSFGNGMPGANGTVRSIVVSSGNNNKILIGGEFGGINYQPSAGIARVFGPPPAPVVTPPAVNNGQFQLALDAIQGTTNVVDATDSLFPVNWVPIYTNLAPFNYVDPNAAIFPQRIYRIRTLQ